MPCYQVNLVSVQFQAKSIPLLEAALRELQWGYTLNADTQVLYTRGMTINLATEKATLDRYDQDLLNQLKVAYSTEVVKAVASKRKWVLKRRAKQQLQARRY